MDRLEKTCAWCKLAVRPLGPAAPASRPDTRPASHTICEACFEVELHRLQQGRNRSQRRPSQRGLAVHI